MKRFINSLGMILLCLLITLSSIAPVCAMDQISAEDTATYIDEKNLLRGYN